MTFTITKASSSNVKRVKPLWLSVVQQYRELCGERWPIRDVDMAWQMRYQEYLTWLSERSAIILVATAEDDAVAGYAVVRLIEADSTVNLGQHYGELESLAVDEEYRRQGLASQLLDRCRQELRKRDVSYWAMSTFVQNSEALSIAEKAGFQPYTIRLMQDLSSPEAEATESVTVASSSRAAHV